MPADISVVVGAQNARSSIQDCLDSILAQTKNLDAEVLVADASDDGTTDIVKNKFPNVTLIQKDKSNLVPHLWGEGMQRAAAPIVAITTAHCIPSKDWIANILSAAREHEKSAGIGGPIDAPTTGSPMDWAVYFSRYTAFLPPSKDGPVQEIPGDNAAYRKAALEKCWHDRGHGFWETLFHHELRNQGESLYMLPKMQVRMGKTDSAWDYFWVRYRHGVHYGSTRPNTQGFTRIARICAAPILMPFLVGRIGMRISSRRPDWLIQYLFALPWLIFFMSGWSLGEIYGYLHQQKNERA